MQYPYPPVAVAQAHHQVDGGKVVQRHDNGVPVTWDGRLRQAETGGYDKGEAAKKILAARL